MPIPSSLTDSYDALLSTTMRNYQKTLVDNITTANAWFYFVKKAGNYVGLDDPGERLAIPLRYSNAPFDSYSGYNQLDVTPIDGITMSFWQWRQAAVPITISHEQRIKNKGDAKIVDLLESKIQQAEDGIIEGFNKALQQGNGPHSATDITSPWTSVMNASQFVDPLPLIVKYDPTTSTTVGNINQSTNSWWQNRKKQSAATTFAGWRKELRNLYNNCAKGPGGPPDTHLVEQQTFELYVAALEAMYRNPDYTKAEIPFQNVLFYGKPVVWDEFVPDVHTGSTAITVGTWFMLNSKFWFIKYCKERNFSTSKFVEPNNQDAMTAHIFWFGAQGISNRRKFGVMGNISLSITS